MYDEEVKKRSEIRVIKYLIIPCRCRGIFCGAGANGAQATYAASGKVLYLNLWLGPRVPRSSSLHVAPHYEGRR